MLAPSVTWTGFDPVESGCGLPDFSGACHFPGLWTSLQHTWNLYNCDFFFGSYKQLLFWMNHVHTHIFTHTPQVFFLTMWMGTTFLFHSKYIFIFPILFTGQGKPQSSQPVSSILEEQPASSGGPPATVSLLRSHQGYGHSWCQQPVQAGGVFRCQTVIPCSGHPTFLPFPDSQQVEWFCLIFLLEIAAWNLCVQIKSSRWD